jgi:hypothetical protein
MARVAVASKRSLEVAPITREDAPRRLRLWPRSIVQGALPVLLLVGPIATATAAGQSVTIGKITVHGARWVSPEIVISESLLETGHQYTEEELELHLRRIVRLPFVLAAEYHLQASSSADTFELIIEIEEDYPLLFELHSTSAATESWRWDLDRWHVDLDRFHTDYHLGARQLVGPRTLIAASVHASDRNLDLPHQISEYSLSATQYGIFGHPLSASIELGVLPGWHGQDDAWQYRVGAALQLPHWQSIRALFLGSSRPDMVGGPDASGRELFPEVEWIYDTTDDELLASDGAMVSGRVSYHWIRAHWSGTTDTKTTWYVDLMGERYVPVAPRHTLGLAGALHYFNQSDLPDHGLIPIRLGRYGYTGRLSGSYALDVWRPESGRGLRCELAAHIVRSTIHAFSDFSTTEYFLRVSTSLLLRTRWGQIGLRLSAGDGSSSLEQ